MADLAGTLRRERKSARIRNAARSAVAYRALLEQNVVPQGKRKGVQEALDLSESIVQNGSRIRRAYLVYKGFKYMNRNHPPIRRMLLALAKLL